MVQNQYIIEFKQLEIYIFLGIKIIKQKMQFKLTILESRIGCKLNVSRTSKID